MPAPTLSRKTSSFGLSSSNKSTGSLGSGLFDRFRGFSQSSTKQKSQEERWRRPLTLRNVETFVEDQRVDECCGGKNRSRQVQISFWVRELPDACQEAIVETQTSMSRERPVIEGGIPEEDLPEGGSYSESLMRER